MKQSKAIEARIRDIRSKTGLSSNVLAMLLNVDLRTITRWTSGGLPSNGALAVITSLERCIDESTDLKGLGHKLRLLAAYGGISYSLYRTLSTPTDVLQKELSP